MIALPDKPMHPTNGASVTPVRRVDDGHVPPPPRPDRVAHKPVVTYVGGIGPRSPSSPYWRDDPICDVDSVGPPHGTCDGDFDGGDRWFDGSGDDIGPGGCAWAVALLLLAAMLCAVAYLLGAWARELWRL